MGLEEHKAKRNYTIAVDFDGVIHSYTTKWIAPDIIPDPPVEGAIEWLNEISKRFKVVVFTTRGKTKEGCWAVSDWLAEQGYDPERRWVPWEITAEKPPALIYLDDRAVRFDGKNFPTSDQIHREFIPWNNHLKVRD